MGVSTVPKRACQDFPIFVLALGVGFGRFVSFRAGVFPTTRVPNEFLRDPLGASQEGRPPSGFLVFQSPSVGPRAMGHRHGTSQWRA